MIDKPPKICPHCGLPAQDAETRAVPAKGKDETLEYDHRGVLMPRRTRIGGIIIPQ